jgi:branched-subunit amino acid transport protein AzlD
MRLDQVMERIEHYLPAAIIGFLVGCAAMQVSLEKFPEGCAFLVAGALVGVLWWIW